MRLGYHYHIPAVSENGQIIMPGYQGCFIDSLAAHCERLTCFLHSPEPGENFNGDYALQAGNVELVDIGPHSSVPRRMLTSRRRVRPLVERRGELDTLLLRGPSPLLPAFARAAGDLPLALLLVGDNLAGIDDLPQPPWRKVLIRQWSRWNQHRQLEVARRSLTFVNSHLLYRQLKPIVENLVETRTTTLGEADFFERADTCHEPPFHLLYAGRMDRSKGLLEMVAALARLVEHGHDCLLDLVGMVDAGDPILGELHARASQLGIPERVIFHGYKPLGPELFACYRKADLYLIASQSSEGFPRTIWEAMANSLPVVATRVGSIPAFIDGSAELVEPGDVDALVQAISRLLEDPDLRQHHIRTGRALARQNTLEVRSREMVRHIQEYIEGRDE